MPPQITDFGFLPIPDEYESVLNEHNCLPLEYVNPDWNLLVSTDPVRGEFAFITGKSLHKNWTDNLIHKFSLTSKNFPRLAIYVACPDESIVAVRIVDYKTAQKQASRVSDFSPKRPPGEKQQPTKQETTHNRRSLKIKLAIKKK